MKQTSVKLMFRAVVTVLFFCAVYPTLGQAIDELAQEARTPTAEAFEAEVEAIREKSEAFNEAEKQASIAYEKARQAHREAIDGLRGTRGQQNDARKAYRAAWDRVRQLLIEDAEQEALVLALKEAQEQTKKLEPVEEKEQPNQVDSRDRMEVAGEALRRASEVHKIAREHAYDYSSLLRAAESTQRRLDREGVYEAFMEDKRETEAKVTSRQKYAERLEKRIVEREKEAAAWEKRWAKMTPGEQVIEVEKLAEQVEAFRAKAKTHEDQHAALLKVTRDLFDKQNDLASETSALRTTRGELQNHVRELIQNNQQDPETQEKLATLRAELDVVIAELENKKALVDQIAAEREERQVKLTAAYREWDIARQEVNVIYTRHLDAQRRISTDPEAAEVDPRNKEINAIREAWQKATGKDVEWGVNPFKGEPLSTEGRITQDGPDLKLFYDGKGYHARMHITEAGRTLHVFDDQAKVLFDGPTNDITHIKDFSQEMYYLWEFLYTQVKFN